MSIRKVSAFANNAVALIAWSIDGPIKGCLGFEVTRVYLSKGDDSTPKGTRRSLASWLPFAGQDNPDWVAESTSVWPIQKMFWRDLTVRQRRDQPTLHDEGVKIKYEVRAVVAYADGLEEVPAPTTPSYQGDVLRLAYAGPAVTSDPVTITSQFGKIQAVFNNGILSTQWLKHTFEQSLGKKLSKAALLPVIRDPNQAIRNYLAGDIIGALGSLLIRAQKTEGAKVYMALYELSDPALVAMIQNCAKQVHLILCNSGQDKTSKEWDVENAPFRAQLRDAGLAEQHDRMFNNSGHIGHNKFVVLTDAQNHPLTVLTGSTNWTPNGLCAQSNNAILIDSPELGKQYLDYWMGLRRDNEVFAVPAPFSATTANRQGGDLRAANAKRSGDVQLDPDTTLTLWRSPNTKAVTKGSATPPDLAEVFSLIRKARSSIFFAVFLPSARGDSSIVSEAIAMAKLDTQLLVYGAISDPKAMPNYVAKVPHENDEDADNGNDAAAGASPTATFDDGNVHVVRASALGTWPKDAIGDFESELLSAGHAIIHDKILVIDPLSPDCAVIIGSHNLGFRASYANDDNLLIVRGNQALAQAYMVHTLDLYEHYRFRALQADRPGDETHQKWEAKLRRDDTWQANYFDDGSHQGLVNYLAP